MKKLNVFGILLCIFSNFVIQGSESISSRSQSKVKFTIEAEDHKDALSTFVNRLWDDIEYVDDLENIIEVNYVNGTIERLKIRESKQEDHSKMKIFYFEEFYQ